MTSRTRVWVSGIEKVRPLEVWDILTSPPPKMVLDTLIIGEGERGSYLYLKKTVVGVGGGVGWGGVIKRSSEGPAGGCSCSGRTRLCIASVTNIHLFD